MIKRSKKNAILFLAFLYAVGVFMAFSGDLLQDLQSIRYESKIKQTKEIQAITFDCKDWNNLENHKEVKFKKVYYDVVSFRQLNSKIIVKAVKDNSENEFRLICSQLSSKHKSPISEKKDTSVFFKQIIVNQSNNYSFKLLFLLSKSKNFNIIFDLKTISYQNIPLQPPC
jgi:hypothetical protein